MFGVCWYKLLCPFSLDLHVERFCGVLDLVLVLVKVYWWLHLPEWDESALRTRLSIPNQSRWASNPCS